MGLGSTLSIATSGLRVNQTALEVAAKNVANADTEGYTRKEDVRTALFAGDQVIGVRTAAVRRASNDMLAGQLRVELSRRSAADVRSDFLSRVDQLFGAPGSSGALDTLYGNFRGALQDLAASPESSGARLDVLTDAQIMATRLNQTAESVQGLRADAERAIGDAVDSLNSMLQRLETVNTQIASAAARPGFSSDLFDQRDQLLSDMSQLLDITVIEREGGTVGVFTMGGATLFNGQAAQLGFDERGFISAETVYSKDPAQRQVGTITLMNGSARPVDLLAGGTLRGGRIGALIEMRDGALVEAQRRLDDFAAGLAKALSTEYREGVSPAPGSFELSLADVRPGDTFSARVNIGGVEQTVTLVHSTSLGGQRLSRADYPGSDHVFAVDFADQAEIQAAFDNVSLGGFTATLTGTDLTLSNGTAQVLSTRAEITETDLAGGGMALPLFVDGARTQIPFSGSLDGRAQTVGFASRIAVNPLLDADPSKLVVYDAMTPAGDPTRPLALLDRLDATNRDFPAGPGSGKSGPFRGSVGGYLQRVISHQGAEAARAGGAREAQAQIVTALQDRLVEHAGVDIDAEMARLIQLQNAYAANARVVQIVDELIDVLMRI
jgi:flagellar hook-associated protein 1 FlgK